MRCRKDLFCLKALQGRTAFGQTPPAKPLQGRQHGRKSAAATGSAGHREIARGVAPGVESSGGLSYHTSRSKDRSLRQLLQKIAFPCRSCRRLRSFDSGFRSCGDPINRAHKKTPMTLTGHRRFFHTLKGWFKRRIRTPAVPRCCTSSR